MKKLLGALTLGLFVTVALVAEPGKEAPQLQTLRSHAARLQPLMQKKTPPEAGDWLAAFPEPGQTFDRYLSANPNRPTKERTVLYIQPIGTFTEKQQLLVGRTKEYLEIAYGLPVKSLPPLDPSAIPASAKRESGFGTQLLTGYILDSLMIPRRPKDAVATIALTTADLWPGKGWNFVFGEATLDQRVGVWSIARFGDPETQWNQVLRRTVGVAVHETGHMLGIEHCTAYECGMNGSNNMRESDRAPLAFCSECDLKLWWACKLDPVSRAEKILKFCTDNDLKRDASDAERRLQVLRAGR